MSCNATDSLRLPTLHTCFDVLLLPDYRGRAQHPHLYVRSLVAGHGPCCCPTSGRAPRNPAFTLYTVAFYVLPNSRVRARNPALTLCTVCWSVSCCCQAQTASSALVLVSHGSMCGKERLVINTKCKWLPTPSVHI